MVESEQKPPQFLTFKHADATATIPVQATYIANDVMKINSALGINLDPSRIYEVIRRLAPNSKVPNQDDLRITHSLTQHDLQSVVKHFIESDEAKKNKNIRSFEITDDEIIDLEGITDFYWIICEPLLNALRTTRNQTESGEIQITPIPFKEVRKLFPDKISQQTIFKLFKILNTSLNPSGWSIEQEGKGPKKPFDAPWFLSGPDDNGVQNKRQPEKPKQKNIFERNLADLRRESAKKNFDRIDFGTGLLHCSLSHLIHPEAKKTFTKNLKDFMSSFLPPDLKLQDVIGDKTLQEYFADSINVAEQNASGKKYEQLSVKQKAIVNSWFLLELESGNDPKTVIFEHFSGHNSKKPLDESNNKNTDAKPMNSSRAPRGKNKEATQGALRFSKQA